jgi:putative proteasome-type protease
MTYCLGIQVDEGLVFAADTRTSASFDDVRTHTKMHVFDFPGERSLVLMSAGNLGTTQAVIARLQRDLSDGAAVSLRTPRHMFEVAEYIGKALVVAQDQVAPASQQNSVSVESTLILGGQIGSEPPALFLIYPLGNCIAASPETPYLQIGESKYGKPILDRIVRPGTTLEDAARCALVSLDSTIRSNVSVGLPVDLALIRAGELKIGERMRLSADTPLYVEIHDSWSLKLEAAVHSLPRFPWEQPDTVATAPTTPSQRPSVPPDETLASQAAQQQQ